MVVAVGVKQRMDKGQYCWHKGDEDKIQPCDICR